MIKYNYRMIYSFYIINIFFIDVEFQKLYFCIVKAIVLHSESYPFAMRNNNF